MLRNAMPDPAAAVCIRALAKVYRNPWTMQVSRGLEPNYDNPYGLMAVMGVNVKLHLVAGLLLRPMVHPIV